MLEGQIGGIVVLVKKDALSLGHFQASLLDGIHHILGQDTGLAFQLVSATKADHREAAHTSMRGIPAAQVANQGMPTPSLLANLGGCVLVDGPASRRRRTCVENF